MYDVDKVVEFIEKTSGKKLYYYQKQILKYIMEGKTFSCPRQAGRTTVVNGLCDYIKREQDRHIDFWETDNCICSRDIMIEKLDREKKSREGGVNEVMSSKTLNKNN